MSTRVEQILYEGKALWSTETWVLDNDTTISQIQRDEKEPHECTFVMMVCRQRIECRMKVCDLQAMMTLKKARKETTAEYYEKGMRLQVPTTWQELSKNVDFIIGSYSGRRYASGNAYDYMMAYEPLAKEMLEKKKITTAAQFWKYCDNRHAKCYKDVVAFWDKYYEEHQSL